MRIGFGLARTLNDSQPILMILCSVMVRPEITAIKSPILRPSFGNRVGRSEWDFVIIGWLRCVITGRRVIALTAKQFQSINANNGL